MHHVIGVFLSYYVNFHELMGIEVFLTSSLIKKQPLEEKKSKKPKLNKEFLYSEAGLVYRDENANGRKVMKIKKLISTIVIIAFLSFAVTPAFAETQAEKDADQKRLVLALIGSVALVGIWFMVTRDNNNLREVQQETTMFDKLPVDIDFSLDYSNTNFSNRHNSNNFSNQSNDEFGTPMFKMKVSW